jgi:hypothetical protein
MWFFYIENNMNVVLYLLLVYQIFFVHFLALDPAKIAKCVRFKIHLQTFTSMRSHSWDRFTFPNLQVATFNC